MVILNAISFFNRYFMNTYRMIQPSILKLHNFYPHDVTLGKTNRIFQTPFATNKNCLFLPSSPIFTLSPLFLIIFHNSLILLRGLCYALFVRVETEDDNIINMYLDVLYCSINMYMNLWIKIVKF
jgi:hypothetical protein